jgi:alpha-tubulin suppressor-like RCC1 family protein
VAGITTAIGINSGGQHSCVLLDDHSVRCWGSNDFGQLGDGTLVESPLPLPVKGLSNVTSLSTGYQHTCAIVNGDSAWCWGANESGQVGTAPSTSVLTPTEVQGTGALLAIAAGRFHTCAIQNTETQSIICWGSNAQSQLGTTTPNQISPTPVNVDNVTHAAAIAAGSQHNCAVIQVANDATEVRCWGWNYYGQLGDGSTTTTMGSAIDVTNATLVSAADHTCALEADGQLQCWGFNRSGELGNGSTQDSSTPTTFTGQVHDANAVSAAAVHTCARFGSGKLMCWGDNSQGQLGDGSTVGSLLPVSVVGL